MRPRIRRPLPSTHIPSPGTSLPSLALAREVAVTVIRWSNRESPADHVLRAELKKARGLNRPTGALAARLVFSYYRWLGWLETDGEMEDQLTRAVELQDQFNADPGSFPEAELVAKAVPSWTRDLLDVTPDWIRAIQAEPVIWLRTKPGQAGEISPRLESSTPGPLPDALAYTGADDLYTHPDFQSGAFEIQDVASQAVGLVCAPQPGETWWDTCAGEGGKTMHLSALMGNKGLIWASDRADWRLARLKRRAARAQAFNYRAVTWDGGERLPTKTKFDGVLVDAPCSGIGTWQRNPHSRWTTRPEDIRELANIQSTLLDRVVPGLKRGGRLVYSVCTLAREETTEVARRFSASHPDFVLERPPVSWLADSDQGPEIWLWPHQWKGNGMYVASWRLK